MSKSAAVEPSWALITESVASAKLNAYRLSHMLHRALAMVENSPGKEHLYQVAGDLIQSVPERLDKLESDLDRASYILSRMGEDSLRDSLPLADRDLVDEAFHKTKDASASRVSVRFLKEQVG